MRHPFGPGEMPGRRRGFPRPPFQHEAWDAHGDFDQPPFPPVPPVPPSGLHGPFAHGPRGPFGPGGPFGHGGFGGPGGFGPGFGFGFGKGGGRRSHARPGKGRARRGNVRAAVLLLLAERPMHGYEIIQEITERSHGWWRPSPGSVYPTLQLLADEGMVTTDQDHQSGKRLYSLTETGTAEAGKQDSTPPWEQAADDVDPHDVALREALSTLMAATMQLSAAGTPDLQAKATKLLVETRRQLYLLLADAGTENTGPAEDSVPDDESDES